MEHYQISELLNYSTVWKFVTRKWIEVNDLLGGQYFADKNIVFKTRMLTSDFCDYSDAYIVVKGTINLKTVVNNDMPQKNNGLYAKSKIMILCLKVMHIKNQ